MGEFKIYKIITEELAKNIKSESVSIYDLVFQSFKAENVGVKKANERTVEVMKDFKNRLVDKLKGK